MKKMDLHIHTVKTQSDYDFAFSVNALKKYVEVIIPGLWPTPAAV